MSEHYLKLYLVPQGYSFLSNKRDHRLQLSHRIHRIPIDRDDAQPTLLVKAKCVQIIICGYERERDVGTWLLPQMTGQPLEGRNLLPSAPAGYGS